MKRKYAQNHDPGLGLDLGWCYLQDGRTDLGIRTVRELEAKVPADRREEYLGLMTKLLAEAAEYEKAISTAANGKKAWRKRSSGIRMPKRRKKTETGSDSHI